MAAAKTVQEFLDAQSLWKSELERLVDVLRSTGLEESIKWGSPVFQYTGKNVVGVSGFKSYFGLWFFQGALLSDPHQVLINAQEGKTRAMRQWRMESAKEIKVTWIRQMINESKSTIEKGISIKPRKTELVIPGELKEALAKNGKAAKSFEGMSPGCRKEYANYVTEAKRAETRIRRVEKILPMILDRQGLNDKYR